MLMSQAIDEYVLDMRATGRFSSERTAVTYRQVLARHVDDTGDRDVTTIERNDVKLTLRRWSNPNTQAKHRSVLVSFYRYLLEEGIRQDNPAQQTRRPRKLPPTVYRPTLDETRRLLAAAEGTRERRAIYLGICAGLRRQEMLGLQGRHFAREGFVWVSPDIAKGKHERWVPVIADLAGVVEGIKTSTRGDHFVLPSERCADPGINRRRIQRPALQSSPQALWRLVKRVGVRAGIDAPITPHTLRHAFGDHLARFAGVRNAQVLLGHADLSTTQAYLNAVPLDELTAATAGFSFLERRHPAPHEP